MAGSKTDEVTMFEVLVASCGAKPGTKVGDTVGHEIEVCKLKPICVPG